MATTPTPFDDEISGTTEDDSIDALAGDDSVFGDDGDDTIRGGEGDDTLFGGDADDELIGDTGVDTIDGGNGDDLLIGGIGADLLIGGDGSDVMDGGEGSDSLLGGSGNDSLTGGSDDDLLHGEEGDDFLQGGEGADSLIGGGGRDTLIGGDGSDRLSGEDDNDELLGGEGDDRLNGGDGDDQLSGDFGDDTLDGGDGRDSIDGGDGDDLIDGGEGDDELDGGNGRNTVNGFAGNDYLTGGDDGSELSGGDGNDTILGGNAKDILYGEDGADLISAGGGDNYVEAGSGDDVVFGDDGKDTLDGGDGSDRMYGGDGNDSLMGFGGNDLLDGGGGDDTLLGFDGADTLYGGEGDDSIEGMQGDDVFVFGGGKDWFDGGAGVDHVRFGFQKQIGILNLDGSFLKVLDFFGNEATLFDVESLEFSDVTVPTNELVRQLQSGKFSLQVESLAGTGYQLSDQIRFQADTGTSRSKVVWFGDDWTESFQTDVGRFLQWSATSPYGNPTVGNLKLPDALKLIESGLSGPDSTLWKDLIALLADMRVGADGQLKFDGFFGVITQESISSKGVGSYDFVSETVDEISQSSAIKQTVRIEGEWTGFFKAKVTQFLEWSATSTNGNPAVGALNLEDALKLIESGIQGSDAFAWKNIVGLLADMRVDENGQLTFDGYLSPFTQQSIVSRGLFDYGLEITSVEDLSKSVPSRQVVKVDDQWTDFFVSKVSEFLNWSRTSPEGNSAIGALSTTNALAVLDGLLRQDPLGAANLIGLLADFSVSASGSLIFDGNFG